MPLRILKALHQLEGRFKEDPILKRPEGNDKTHVCQLRTVHLPDEIGRKGPSLIADDDRPKESDRSEEHTSELQSRLHLVCRLLLEKKKNKQIPLPSN